MTDGLTGVANRKCFDDTLGKAIEEAIEGGEPLSLIMLDLDHFKAFNDTYGHQVGDQVLKLLGRTLVQCVKGQDTAARYGGEEFAVIPAEYAFGRRRVGRGNDPCLRGREKAGEKGHR